VAPLRQPFKQHPGLFLNITLAHAMLRNFIGLLIGYVVVFAPANILAQVVTHSGISALRIDSLLTQPGLDISNVTITCDSFAYGEFEGNSELPFTHGIAITTGSFFNCFTRNDSANSSSAYNTQATIPAFNPTYDLCLFEFDAVSATNTIRIPFSFGSEEYPEYVNSAYDDEFEIQINGINPDGGNYTNWNFAWLPDNTTLSINHVNDQHNQVAFYNNMFPSGSYIEHDGLTNFMYATVNVVPGQLYHIVFVIGDRDDPFFDSGGFIAASDSEIRHLPVAPPSGVDCYPNPVVDFVTWLPEANTEIYSAELYDQSGRIVHKVEDPLSQRSINMTAYACGYYFLRIETYFRSYTFKVVKV
jgi:hypothetical protein